MSKETEETEEKKTDAISPDWCCCEPDQNDLITGAGVCTNCNHYVNPADAYQSGLKIKEVALEVKKKEIIELQEENNSLKMELEKKKTPIKLPPNPVLIGECTYTIQRELVVIVLVFSGVLYFVNKVVPYLGMMIGNK